MSYEKLTNNMRRRQSVRRDVAMFLCNNLTIGEEVKDFAAPEVAGLTGIAESKVSDALKSLDRDVKMISRRYEYATKGMRPGRRWHMTLLSGPAEVTDILDDLDEQEIAEAMENRKRGIETAAERRRGKVKVGHKYVRPEMRTGTASNVAVRFEDDEPVEAIAGPEPESPMAALRRMDREYAAKNEPKALVEAARQYAARTSTIQSKIDDIIETAKELGITINEQTIRESFSYDRDERLENVALVLPYIDDILYQLDIAKASKPMAVEGASAQMTPEYLKLKRDYDKLSERFKLLVSQQVASHEAQAAAAN